MTPPVKAAVFGTGSWGTAFAMVLADAGCEVVLCARRQEVADEVNTAHTNSGYLPGAVLPASVRATTDPAEAAADADFTVLTVPSQTARANLTTLAPLLAPDTVVVSLMKGVELGSAMRMSEVIADTAKLPPSGSPSSPAPTSPGRSPPGSPPPPWSPAPTRTSPGGSRPPATPRTSARTPTPTWSAANWAVPSRTSSASPSASRTAWASATTPRAPHHPRPRRDHPARPRHGRRPDDLLRPRRPRRPGGDLLLAALAEPHLRHQPRQGDDAGGDHRGHQADRGGRQVLRIRARPRPLGTASTCPSPRRSSASCTTGSRRWSPSRN